MIEKLSASSALSRYASGERSFSWKDLSGLDLHGADLRDTNLFGSNVSRTNLTDASARDTPTCDVYSWRGLISLGRM